MRGATLVSVITSSAYSYFNPRSPCGERPRITSAARRTLRFQSTLPVRGATAICDQDEEQRNISIHAPRAGSDPRTSLSARNPRTFQSTLPVRGATVSMVIRRLSPVRFQSTLPVRGATSRAFHSGENCKFQSTLPVRGATKREVKGWARSVISIHAPRAGSDACVRREDSRLCEFQSTLPVRGATKWK